MLLPFPPLSNETALAVGCLLSPKCVLRTKPGRGSDACCVRTPPVGPAAAHRSAAVLTSQRNRRRVNTAPLFGEVSGACCTWKGWAAGAARAPRPHAPPRTAVTKAITYRRATWGCFFQVVFNSVRTLQTQLIAGGRFLCYLGHRSPTVLTQT